MQLDSQTPRPALHAVIGFLVISIGFGLIACYDHVPTEPTKLLPPPPARRFDLQPFPPSSITLGAVPGTRTLVAVYPFIEQLVVQGKITGTVGVTSHPLASFQVNGNYDYRGYSQSSTWGTQCGISAFFEWGISVSPPQNCVAGVGGTWTDTIRVADSVFAKRGPPVQEATGQCLSAPCHEYGPSSQVLTLTPIAAGLKYAVTTALGSSFLTEAQMTAYYAPYTAFRSTAVPVAIGPFATPRRFLQRAWRKGDPSVPPWNTDINGYCPQSISVCDLPVRETGIFWAKERVNGVEREDSVAVNCALGDSLLDFAVSRRAYLDAVAATNASAPNPNDRVERVFAIVEYPGPPAYLDAFLVATSVANRCEAIWVGAITPNTGVGKVRAYVHTHPTSQGVTVFTCPGGNQQYRAGPGLSPRDDSAMKVVNKQITDNFTSSGWAPVPFYVIDNEWVYRLKPGQPVAASRKPPNAWKWKGGRCAWVHPTNSQMPVTTQWIPW